MTVRALTPTCTALALDIGGTKIEVGLIDVHGTVMERRRTATKADDPHLFEGVVALLHEVSSDTPFGVLGVGCGGPMTKGGETVSPLNIPAWREFALREKLSDLFDVPVFVDNDAKALALGEGLFGAARGVPNYLSMVVSTGVGGGIVLDGELLDGRDGNAGHIGHVTVVPDGRLCGCGARGCLEAEASGTAIASITGAPASEASIAVRRRTGELVGHAVVSAAALLDFDRCFVAGSVALGFAEDFFDAANEAVRRTAHIQHARSLVIAPSGLGADGPLLGAAAVGWRGLHRG